MEKCTNVAIGKVGKEEKTQEALGQSKMNKFVNGTKKMAGKFMNSFNTTAVPVIENLGKEISKIRINWFGILVVVILAYLAKNGYLNEMPHVKWLVESTIRLIEWLFGLLYSIMEGVTKGFDSKFCTSIDLFGIVEALNNWLKAMFAL